MQKYTSIIENIKKLLSNAKVLTTEEKELIVQNTHAFYVGLDNPNIAFVGLENYNKFIETIEVLFNVEKDIHLTYSIDEFERHFGHFLCDLKRKNKQCNESMLEQFLERLKDVEIQSYEILHQIHGINISCDSIQLGDFRIYKIPNSINQLKKTHPRLNNPEWIEKLSVPGYLIGLKVLARDEKKAYDETTNTFGLFEDIINYMRFNAETKSKLRIFNPAIGHSHSTIICNKESITSATFYNNVDDVNLESNLFLNEEFGNNKIWQFATKRDKTDIQKRIVSAIRWVGKGVMDNDKSKSLVQFIFAIEGMFQSSENTIFTPSILNSISSNLAFLIGSDYEKRTEIAKLFKCIYKRRSAVAHGGTQTITQEELNQAHRLACLMIVSFLTKEPFCFIKSIAEFNQHIDKLKFS